MKQIKLILFFSLFSATSFAHEITVSQAAEIILDQPTSIKIPTHTTHLLDIIARYGHSLPQSTQLQLQEKGFNFTRELVTTDRPLNLDQYEDQGIFRFHYTLFGDDAVDSEDESNNGIPDYVDTVLAVFAKISSIDFDSLNYSEPPSDGWYFNQENGGSAHYDVYIFELDPGYYGYVQAENYAQADDVLNAGDNENSDLNENNAMVSFMAIRNNYDSFPGEEIDIIKATSAHEFFHSVQYGYDGWEFGWVKEATAVWMEELLYDDINDCYQFLEDFFDDPDVAFNYNTERGYGAYILFAYLTENWAPDELVKSYWENSILFNSWYQDYSIETLQQTLIDYELDFEMVIQGFLIANGLLSSDSLAGVYRYEESDDFPMEHPEYEQTIELIEGDQTEIEIENTLGTFSAQYYMIEPDGDLISAPDSCCIYIELNTNYESDPTQSIYLSLVHGDTSYSQNLVTTGETFSIIVGLADSLTIMVSGFNYNNEIVNEWGELEWEDVEYSFSIYHSISLGIPDESILPRQVILGQNFPNPFNGQTNIPLFTNTDSDIRIDIYNIRGHLIQTLISGRPSPGSQTIVWNGLNLNGEEISSGPYFLHLKSESFQKMKKMVYIK